jgi:hypothetical protein
MRREGEGAIRSAWGTAARRRLLRTTASTMQRQSERPARRCYSRRQSREGCRGREGQEAPARVKEAGVGARGRGQGRIAAKEESIDGSPAACFTESPRARWRDAEGGEKQQTACTRRVLDVRARRAVTLYKAVARPVVLASCEPFVPIYPWRCCRRPSEPSLPAFRPGSRLVGCFVRPQQTPLDNG